MTQLAKLEALRNRITRYELALINGDTRILVCYSMRRGRHTLFEACRKHGPAIVALTCPSGEELLTSTLDRPNVIPVNCSLAIESVAKLISPAEQNKAKQWAKIRQKLNVTEAYLKFVTDLSKKPRHGDFTDPPTDDQLEARRRAWVVMNRYLEFINRGGVASLCSPEFPEV